MSLYNKISKSKPYQKLFNEKVFRARYFIKNEAKYYEKNLISKSYSPNKFGNIFLSNHTKIKSPDISYANMFSPYVHKWIKNDSKSKILNSELKNSQIIDTLNFIARKTTIVFGVKNKFSKNSFDCIFPRIKVEQPFNNSTMKKNKSFQLRKHM